MRIKNRKAIIKYMIIEKYEAGIVLTGLEVKAVKSGGVDLSNAYVKMIGNEAYLINLIIQTGKDKNPLTFPRRLLLHKSQITTIGLRIKAKKLTFVPISIYTKGRLVKLELALVSPKKKFKKREILRKKDIDRDIERELKLARKGN